MPVFNCTRHFLKDSKCPDTLTAADIMSQRKGLDGHWAGEVPEYALVALVYTVALWCPEKTWKDADGKERPRDPSMNLNISGAVFRCCG